MSAERSIYLDVTPIPEAIERIEKGLEREDVLKKEVVPVSEAIGRITAGPIHAVASSPTFHSAAMDGIAVAAEDTFQAREGRPVELKVGQTCHPVNTGDPLPQGCNAVIMIEEVHEVSPELMTIEQPAFPWQHVRRIGEDIVATELVLPQNHRLTPYDLGALLSGGIFEVEVLERPHLVIIPTGDEVLDFTLKPSPKPGQVIESNSMVLRHMAESWGCRVTRTPPVPDSEEALAGAVQEAIHSGAHLVVIGAGSSAGSKDFTRTTLNRFGTVLVHGIAAMPGKPSLLGVSGNTILVGAPGYPVSSVICFEYLVRPLIAWLGHQPSPARSTVPVHLTRDVPSKLGQEEFLRLCIGRVGDRLVGTPLPRGAGMITSMTKAQGICRIPADSEGQKAEKPVPTELLVPEEVLDQILVCIGSHDNTLDLLTNALMGLEEPITLASTHVGSMGGLMALKKGSTHMAGCHLFDPETQDYNFPFLERYLPDLDLAVINLAVRHQGFIVAPDNSKGISSIQDLKREDVRFINRQRGAGTRILLDDHLAKAGIRAEEVSGYDQEEFTHMAVAVNVQSGAADCGMGIYAAAKALNLGFVPLAKERYDLVIPRSHLDNPKITSVLELLSQEEFKKAIRDLGGYETDLTGQTMQPGMGLGKT